VIGAVVQPDRRPLPFSFLRAAREDPSNLKNNGRVALAVGLLTHEAYQLKGVYVSSRPTDTRDYAVQEIYRSKVLSAFLQAGYPEQIAKPYILGFVYQPGVAITFRVDEIFLQTPGPEAGKKIG
jgi:hypothetical protein